MEYNKMTDSELANIMINYIGRIENLQNIIGRYLEGNRSISSLKIREEYKNLKEELRRDASYIRLERNSEGSKLYRGAFVPSIREAAAYGFCVSSNSSVNGSMYNAVAEANFKLNKYYSLEEWGRFM